MGIPVFNQWAEYFVIDEPPMHARGRSGKCERGQQNEWCCWQKRQDNADHAEHQGNNAKTEPDETLHDRTAKNALIALPYPRGKPTQSRRPAFRQGEITISGLITALYMQCRPEGAQRRFLQGLPLGWVRMNGTGNIFQRGPHFDGKPERSG